jgi:single-strand DNA-binding protein
MGSLSQIVVQGNLTKAPVATEAGRTPVVKFTVCVNQRDKSTAYYNVSVFGAQGDACFKYLAKGQQATVAGRLEFREYKDRDGNARTSLDVNASEVQFGPAPDGDRGRGRDEEDRGGRSRDRDRDDEPHSRGRDRDDEPRGRGRDDEPRGRGRDRDDEPRRGSRDDVDFNSRRSREDEAPRSRSRGRDDDFGDGPDKGDPFAEDE